MENTENTIEKKSKRIIEFFKKNSKWLILIVGLILFFVILEDILDEEIHEFDNAIYSIVSKWINEPTTIIAKIITTIGSSYVIIPVCLISVVCLWKQKLGKYIGVNLIIIFFSNQLLKNIIQRPRPEGFRIVEQSGYSFPSGHSMVSMAFYGLFIYLIHKKVKSPIIKWTCNIALSLLIIFIGLSRIYLGVHYASDVVAGFCLSISYLLLFTHVIKDNI